MKITLLFFCFITSFLTFGQTKIDELVSVKFPQEPSINDTVIQRVRIKTTYLNNEIEGYSVIKMKMGSKEEVLTSLPYDTKSLDEYYQGLIKGQSEKLLEGGYKFNDSIKIDIDGFIAYKTSFLNAETDVENARFIHLILNEYSYTFGYISHKDFNTENISSFFASIEVYKEKKTTQFVGKSKAYKQGYIIGKVFVYGSFAALILWLIFRKTKK